MVSYFDTINGVMFASFIIGIWNPEKKNIVPKNYIYTLINHDSSKQWIIDEVEIKRIKGDDYCDCGEEELISVRINNETINASQFPFVLTK
ncbi:MAG: hypothetical protein ACK4K9_09370 [Bacteroidia bacterium]